MKRFLLWSFERGSKQYDVICVVILAFIFLMPSSVFHDRPDSTRVAEDQLIRQTNDDDGHMVFTVKVNTTEQAAVEQLKASLRALFTGSVCETLKGAPSDALSCS